MTQAVKDLIAQAQTVTEYESNDKLKGAVVALEALGEDAKGSTNEYKELKAMLDDMEDNLTDEQKEAQAKKEAQAQAKKKPAKKLSMAGVKMIGGKWYHESDNYAKAFDTTEECAKHYNG